MVLHWNCWALIVPVLWLVFLPSRHLFHPSPRLDVFAQRAAKVFVLSSECCLENYWCMLLQLDDGSVKGFTKSQSLLPACPALDGVVSQLCPWCVVLVVLSFTKEIFVLQSNGTFIVNVNHYRNDVTFVQLHLIQPLFLCEKKGTILHNVPDPTFVCV